MNRHIVKGGFCLKQPQMTATRVLCSQIIQIKQKIQYSVLSLTFQKGS